MTHDDALTDPAAAMLDAWNRRAARNPTDGHSLGHEIATRIAELYAGRRAEPPVRSFTDATSPRRYELIGTPAGPQMQLRVITAGRSEPLVLGSGPGRFGFRGVSDAELGELAADWSSWLGAAVAADLGILPSPRSDTP